MRIAERLARLEAARPRPARQWDFSRMPTADLEFVEWIGRQGFDGAAQHRDDARLIRILEEAGYADR